MNKTKFCIIVFCIIMTVWPNQLNRGEFDGTAWQLADRGGLWNPE